VPIWLSIICLTISMALLDIGITGKTYSRGRGGQRGLLASTTSFPLRSFLFVIGLLLIGWVVLDFVHRIGH
jgi:hypothetical protein